VNESEAMFSSLAADAVAWSWSFGDGNSSTLEHPVHDYGANGDYTACLEVTSTEGCTNDTCMVVTISGVGVELLLQNGFSVYPNPVAESFWIALPSDLSSYQLRITDVLGNLLYSQSGAADVLPVNCSHWPAGVYLLHIVTDNDRQFATRLVKH
jgi:hypothetical protein